MTAIGHPRSRAHEERGWALITALILMSVMLGLGMGVLALADQQTQLSGVERQKDTAFNAAESTLNATIWSLSNNWPGPGIASPTSTLTAFPTCTPSSIDPRCPNAGQIRNSFNTPDATNGGLTWTVNVYDNGVDSTTNQSSASFYNDTITPRQVSYDANGDGKLWVRAQATVAGHSRALVEQAVIQRVPISMPRAAVVAGSLNISNLGNKVLIDTQGTALQPAPVLLRCSLLNIGCLLDRVGQITPDTSSGSYGGGASVSSTGLAAIKATAIANGTYFTSCPASIPNGTVWLEGVNCDFTANQTVNSSQNPGLLVINNGTAIFEGTMTFYGVIYNTDAQGSSGNVITFGGNANLYGSVQVDGNGVVIAGSSQLNITFDPNAFAAIIAYGSADAVPGTFRQLPVG